MALPAVRTAPTALWARVAGLAARLAPGMGEAALDRAGRERLWRIFTELTRTVSALAAADAPLAEGLRSLRSLSGRVSEELRASPPPTAAPTGVVPAQLHLLALLSQDLEPFLARWRARLEASQQGGRPEADRPLREICRGDLERTRLRLVERSWRLGDALGLPGLETLLPQRPAAAPALTPAEDLAAAEAAAAAAPDAGALRAGWEIYVEVASRLPPPGLAPGGGRLGEAIGSLQTLAGEVRAALKAMAPSRSGRWDDAIETHALRLLNEGLTPFLAEWGPRYQMLEAAGRSETKWGRAEACRAALAATRERVLPIIRALGRKVGAPPLLESPLRLPPPLPAPVRN